MGGRVPVTSQPYETTVLRYAIEYGMQSRFRAAENLIRRNVFLKGDFE